ncbi:MAG: acetylxylan esterase [Planctomycetes bacterium]|nr:acetylxylan esterase [Planctomycetota bacterium]
MKMNCAHSAPTMAARLALLSIAWLLLDPAGRLLGAPETSESAPAGPSVRVAGIVLKWIRGDKEANFRRAEPMIREAAARGAKIVCTTECFLDGYAIADKSIPLDAYRALGEPIPDGPYFRRLAALADELDIHLVAGMLEADGDLRFNAAVLLGPDGKLIGEYRKQKLGHESERNQPGNSSSVFATPHGRSGILICADRRDRDVVRRFFDRGAQYLLCPSGGMFGPRKNDRILQARSRENGAYIVFVHPAEFLVTGPDGSIVERTILGDRLLVAPADVDTEVDSRRVFLFDLPLGRLPAGARSPLVSTGAPDVKVDDIKTLLEKRIIDPSLPLAEVRTYTKSRVPRMAHFDDVDEWEAYAEDLRRKILERVVLRGEGARWSEAATRVEWLGEIEGGPGYRIRRVRFEALPGLWIAALLYEPEKLEGKVPVVLNVNGHDGKGKAAPYKQIRCINQAKRGMIALNVEWLGMGQLRGEGYGHYRMNQLDLCGTSGLAPFYLSMKRSLDLLLSLEHADPERAAVAGLSGGGWQTITISSLDTRVTLCNPVAGYGSFLIRADYPADLGDSEQTPVDLATLADYTHLTALLAPRPALLTYNANDDCCFKAAHSIPPLVDAAGPIYELYSRGDVLRTHVNHDPGTHNFERENREVLYRMLGDFFFPEKADFDAKEIPSDAEVKSLEQLLVDLPEGNADFHSLAATLAKDLPRRKAWPDRKEAASSWQEDRRSALKEIVRWKELAAAAERVETLAGGDHSAISWKLRLGDTWTLPAMEIYRGEPRSTVILVADAGRASLAAEVEKRLETGERVLALDPFYLGESRITDRDFLYAMLLAALGDRALGLQASQVAAVARWLKSTLDGAPVRVAAHGERSSLFALVAAAIETEAIDSVELRGSMGSLREIIERNLSVNQAPELFCFGLLETFDIRDIAALVAPRTAEFLEASDRAREELAPLAAWRELLGAR